MAFKYKPLTHTLIPYMTEQWYRSIQSIVRIFCIIIIVGFSQVVYAQPNIELQDLSNKTINVQQSIQIALANNTQMKRSLVSLMDADQQIRTAWSNVMPNIAASANYTRNLEVPVNFIPAILFDPNADPGDLTPIAFGTDNSWQGGFSVSQTIFSGQAFVGISSSELYKTAQTENMRATAQGIVTQTRVAFYEALVSKEQLRLIKAQIDRVKKNLEDNRIRLKQGFIDEYAVLQLEVQLSNLEPQLIQAEFSVENAKQELLNTIGLPVHLQIQVKGSLSEFDIYADKHSVQDNAELKEIDTYTPYTFNNETVSIKQAMDLRGDLRILNVQKNLQGKQLDAQRSTYLPNITASYNLNWSATQAGAPVFFGTEDSRARSQTVSVGVQVPLFQGFRRDASIQIAKLQVKDTELQLAQAKQTANKEIFSASQGVNQALFSSDALKKALEQAQLGYERATLRYQNGVGSQQEVTDADLQFRQAEINYAQMIFSYLTAKAQYDFAIGQVPFVEQNIQEIKEKIELN